MPLHPRTCSLLYSISCLLDALDGVAARRFNQSTRFGAVLDMVTDRCTTSCLLVFLSSAFPRWALLFQGLISLDFASHYMHMYATLAMGEEGQSHKRIDKSRSRLLYLYYNNRVWYPLCFLLLRRENRLTKSITDRPLPLLRPERNLLYRPLPPLLLLPHAHTLPPPRRRYRRCFLCPTRKPFHPPLHLLRYPRQRLGNGTRARKQNGQFLALGHRGRVLSRNGGEAGVECGADGQGEQVAGRGGYQGAEGAGIAEEEVRSTLLQWPRFDID